MEKEVVIIDASVLQNYVQELFKSSRVNTEDSEFIAKALVDSNLYGIDSHGVMRVPIYIKRFLNKAVTLNPNFKFNNTGKAIEIMDGDNGSGIIVGKKAMEKAIELAKSFGVGVVGVKRSNHYGACAIYTRMAVEEGMVGISMTNVKPLIIAPGAEKPVVGNNPFSIAIPTYNDFPFMLDMALSVVAGGKLSLAIKKGEKIPKNWATDKNGRPTDDPKEAFAGYLLPMGEYKGLGLAYAIDMLSGLLTGAEFGYGVQSMYEKPEEPSHTGHMMIAINVDKIIGKDQIKERMKRYHDDLMNTPMWDENKKMYFPGELESILYKQRKEEGIPIPIKIHEELEELGRQLGFNKSLEYI
ncbi:Ldh family oxidoreductase [Natronincola ferrireducens]|uniref:Malate/lactate/ureidoglycolate dehydrogenase, LDH2 family n=1 Tax=Natronincola ferrireducens TaxID=393762 RepID=A0A1G9GEQ5_9FIRM|nr:Ldh family oxidoreductase [Natronincola ferrireducens]SDK99055.1 Malate/lactate/ureidoglycolate dehydrogenase, LDH2 family [Natronincola ferrireducens]